MGMYHAGTDVAFVERSISEPTICFYVPYEVSSQRVEQSIRVRGTRSLEATAVRVAVRHANMLTTRTLEGLPWRLAEKIWRIIMQRQASIRMSDIAINHSTLVPFSLWKTFVMAYAQEAPKGNFVDVTFELSLKFSLPRGIEIGTAWLTEMSIDPNLVTFQDLIGLYTIPSLAILLLNYGHPDGHGTGEEVDDRLVQNWARSAKEAGGFANLRIISFYGCRYLTVRCLEFLCSMPSLKWTTFDSCKQIPWWSTSCSRMTTVADCYGWKYYDVKANGNTAPVSNIFHPSRYDQRDWHKIELRRIQLEASTFLNDPESERDLKKPIFSILCGKRAPFSMLPLMFERVKPARSPGYDKWQSIENSQSNQSKTDIKASKRQIKRRKLDDAEDFGQLLL